MKIITNKLLRQFLLVTSVGASASVLTASTDYGPAVWTPLCNANWYTSGNGHHFAVIHDMEGYYLSTISYFASCSHTSSSVYYAVNGKQDTSTDHNAGEITQMVRESNYAWHACCWNTWMFGTEHEGFANNPSWYTATMYQTSAALQKHLSNVGGFPINRNHIIGHNEHLNASWRSWLSANYPSISGTCNTHTDPGSYWDWDRYMALISPPANYAPTIQWGPITHEAFGAMRLFVAGNQGQVFYGNQDVPNGTWNGWTSLDSFAKAVPGCVAGWNADGRVECLVVATNGAIYHDWQVVPNGDFSGSWSQLGTLKGFGLAMTANADGRMEAFALDNTSSNVYTAYQGSPNGSWGSWAKPGGNTFAASEICTIPDANGAIFLFGVGTDGYVYRCNQSGANGSFGSWTNMGFQATQISVAANANGHLELFGRDPSGALGHAWQNPAPDWSAWSTNLNAVGSSPIVAPCQDGHLEMFFLGADKNVYRMWQSGPNGSWPGNGPTQVGTNATSLAVHYNEDGRLEVFWVVGGTKDIYHIWQTSTGSYSSGASLGGSWRGL